MSKKQQNGSLFKNMMGKDKRQKKEIRVLLDHQIFNKQKYGGISRMFMELYTSQKKEGGVLFRLPEIYTDNEYLKSGGVGRDFPVEKGGYFRKLSIRIISRILSIKSILKTEEYDLFQPTYYDPYFLAFLRKKPFVLVVFDMTYEKMSKYFSPRAVFSISMKKRILLQKAEKIIAISENTKKDLMQIYGVEGKKIEVVYLASSLDSEVSDCKDLDLPDRYLLFVGRRSGYKNFNFFVSSIAELLQEEKDLYLICAGGGNFSASEVELLRELKIEKKVRYINFKSDEELSGLYRNALTFVFPSLYEGFGIPILEAFSCDCPVAISGVSSFPEVAEDAAVYFDPSTKASIKTAVTMLVRDEERRSDLIKKGRERLKDFSWEKTVNGFVEVYKSLQ